MLPVFLIHFRNMVIVMVPRNQDEALFNRGRGKPGVVLWNRAAVFPTSAFDLPFVS